MQSFTMQSREETTLEQEQPEIPGSVSPSPVLEQQTGESEAYSAEEQALVEERLKNLGYL